jgi:hypothetical protein
MKRAARSHEDPMEDVCMHGGVLPVTTGARIMPQRLEKSGTRVRPLRDAPMPRLPRAAALKVVRSARCCRTVVRCGAVTSSPRLANSGYMTDRSDLVLIRAARSDAAAFGELYERHVFAIHGWLRRRVGEPAATDLTAVVALALVAISAATAIANGWILDDGATFSQADQVQQAPRTSVEFALEIRIGQLTNPVEQPGQLVIPPGSCYAGTLMRRADGDAGHTCVRALAGGGCGVLSPTQPIMGGVISFGASKTLPPLAYGAIAPGVTSVTITCPTGTFQATLIDRRVYEAILTFGRDTGRCSATSN